LQEFLTRERQIQAYLDQARLNMLLSPPSRPGPSSRKGLI
jgi:hypothetical protein